MVGPSIALQYFISLLMNSNMQSERGRQGPERGYHK